MMFAKFHLSTICRHLLCLQFISGLCLIQITVTGTDLRTSCIHNLTASSWINTTFGISDKIEVVSIYYDHRQTSSSGCSQSPVNTPCHRRFTTGLELVNFWINYFCLPKPKRCYGSVGPLQPATDCDNMTPFNFVLIEYRCIPETDFIDLCGNVVNIISSVKHLGYFRKFVDNQFQNCTCSIQGPHTLTAVDAGGFGRKGNCKPFNLWFKTHTDTSETTTNSSHPDDPFLINVKFKGLQSSYIRLISNCSPDTPPPAWFKIIPDNGETVKIQCGQPISTSSGTKATSLTTLGSTRLMTGVTSSLGVIKETSTEEGTEATSLSTLGSTSLITGVTISRGLINETSTEEGGKNTIPKNEKNTQLPVIIGSVAGSLVIIIVLIVVGGIVYRRKQNSSRGKVSTTHTTNGTSGYDDAFELRIPSYIDITNYSEIVQRHEMGKDSGKPTASETNEYDDACIARIPSYISLGNDSDSDQHYSTIDDVYANEYEDMAITNGRHTHDYENTPNHEYSTFGQSVDDSGNYAELKL